MTVPPPWYLFQTFEKSGTAAMRGYSQEFKDEVLRSILIEEMPIKKACRVFHLSRDTVRLWVRREKGLLPQANHVPTPSEIKEQAVKDILNGASTKEVALRLNKSRTAIYSWLRENREQQLLLELENYRKTRQN